MQPSEEYPRKNFERTLRNLIADPAQILYGQSPDVFIGPMSAKASRVLGLGLGSSHSNRGVLCYLRLDCAIHSVDEEAQA